MMDEPQIEPELLLPPPRRTKRRGTRGFGALFSQYFLLPIFAMTLAMVLWWTHLFLVRAVGPVTNAQIVDRFRKRDGEDKHWLHYLKYRADIKGRSQTLIELIDEKSFEKTPLGSKVPLKLSPVLPGYDSLLLIPGRDIWGLVWGIGFATLLLVGGNGLLAWYIYILPVRRRELVKSGVPVVGKLVEKTNSTGGNHYSSSSMPVFYFHYEYTPVGFEGAPLVARQGVRQSDWDKPQVGEAYTVLYDAENPKSSVIYLYGDYEVDVR